MEETEVELQQNLREKVSQQIPNGRFASADEVAEVILWLSSSTANYIVGQTIVMDGGLGLT